MERETMVSAMVTVGGSFSLFFSSLLADGETADGVVTDLIQATTQIPHYREDSTRRTSLASWMALTTVCVMDSTLRTLLS